MTITMKIILKILCFVVVVVVVVGIETLMKRRRNIRIPKTRRKTAVAVVAVQEVVMPEEGNVGEERMNLVDNNVIQNAVVKMDSELVQLVRQQALPVLGRQLLPELQVPMPGSLELNTVLGSTSLKLEMKLCIYVKVTLQFSLLQVIEGLFPGKLCIVADS
jgi:hypothetical protein